MYEGWLGEDYVILFDETESGSISDAYGIKDYLPGHSIVAIVGWDEFVVRDGAGNLFQLPTVPLGPDYMRPVSWVCNATDLQPDERFTGKIKWYVQPVIFGGDPDFEENTSWIDMRTHQELVRWWNDKFRSISGR